MAVGTVINWLHGILVTRLRWAFSNELESLFKVWYVVEPFFMSLHYWTTRTLGDLWAATFNFQPFEPSWLRPLRPSGTQAVWPRHSIHSMHTMRCIALVGLQSRDDNFQSNSVEILALWVWRWWWMAILSPSGFFCDRGAAVGEIGDSIFWIF